MKRPGLGVKWEMLLVLAALGTLLVSTPVLDTVGEVSAAVGAAWQDFRAFRRPLLLEGSGQAGFPVHVPLILEMVTENDLERFALSPALRENRSNEMFLTAQAWPRQRLLRAQAVFLLEDELLGFAACHGAELREELPAGGPITCPPGLAEVFVPLAGSGAGPEFPLAGCEVKNQVEDVVLVVCP